MRQLQIPKTKRLTKYLAGIASLALVAAIGVWQLVPPVKAEGTIQWTGATSTDWHDESNWNTEQTPGETDVVVIDGGDNQPVLDVAGGSITVRGLQIGDTTDSVLELSNSLDDKKLIITDDLIVGGSGVVTHSANSDSHLHSLILEVGGDVTVEAGGEIDVSGKGFFQESGPGSGLYHRHGSNRYYVGAAHGGDAASLSSSAPGASAYGDVSQPRTVGSGAYLTQGGGAVEIDVGGNLAVFGDIHASGVDGSHAGGAGGSIFITAKDFSGSGDILANGGDGGTGGSALYMYGSGSGGRISINYENNSFQGSALARGGSAKSANGAAGTILTKQIDSQSSLVVDNDGIDSSSLTPQMGEVKSYDNFTVTGGANYGIANGEVLNVGTIHDAAGPTADNRGSLTIDTGGTWNATEELILRNYNITNRGSIGTTINLTLDNSKLEDFGGFSEQLQNVTAIGENSEFSIGTTSLEQPLNLESLTISDGAVVTHPANQDTQQHTLNIEVVNDVVVDDRSSIDVGGKGYFAAGPGAGMLSTSSSDNTSGAGYGGEGGIAGASSSGGSAYGSVKEPIDIGSGGVSERTEGGSFGGGALRLVVEGNLILDGELLANGASGTRAGGGSGGSIWVDASSFSGGGFVAANGADGAATSSSISGGGGGGRIAVHYITSTFTGSYDAHGGTGGSWSGSSAENGAAGTIYTIGPDGLHGNLTISNANQATTANTPQLGEEVVYDNFNLSGNASYYIPENNTLRDTHIGAEGGVRVVVDGTWRVASESLVLDGLSVVNNGSLVDVRDMRVLSSKFQQNGIMSTENLTIGSGGNFEFQNTTPDTPAVLNSLIIESGGMVEHTSNTTAQNHTLNIEAANRIEIQQGGAIDVSERGYSGQSGPGAGSGTSGGGYGGPGGSHGSTTGGSTYGSEIEPVDIGSGGGGNTRPSGGGAVKLTAGESISVDGQIYTNGRAGQSSYGGGSGGSVWLTAPEVLGSGDIQASGGDGYYTAYYRSGGGGGGRVSINRTKDQHQVYEITPNSGGVEGGNTVTILGEGFTNNTAVMFVITSTDGEVYEAEADTITVDNSTLSVIVPPAPFYGDVEVKVINRDFTGLVSVNNGGGGSGVGPGTVHPSSPGANNVVGSSLYSYFSAPIATSVQPSSGIEHGGDTVTVSGSGFRDGATVWFGLSQAETTFVDSNTLSAVVPAALYSGTVDVRVVNPGSLEATIIEGFTYLKSSPLITSISPSRGPANGGQEVEISGSNFAWLGLIDVSSGGSHSLGLNSSGQVYAWGPGSSGQLGNGSTDDQSTPVAVDTSGVLAGKTITAIAAGGSHSLALDSDGQVYAWGAGGSGRLGNGSTDDQSTPVAVDMSGVLSDKTIIAISAGSDHSLALSSDGQVYAWGNNSNGRLGNGDSVHQTTPVAVDTSGVLAGKTITAISAGQAFSLALSSDGQVYAWGSSIAGQLGNGGTNSITPVAVNTEGVLSGKTITAIAAGNTHALAVDSDGQVYAWGSRASGRLGDGGSISGSQTTPVAIDTDGVLSGKVITTIAAGSSHSLALDSDGQVYAWGSRASGRLGNGGSISGSQTTPVAVNTSGVLAGKAITAIAAGTTHSLAIDFSGDAYAWGSRDSGRLGDGITFGSENTPILVDKSYLAPPQVSFGGVDGKVVSTEPLNNSLLIETPPHHPGVVDVTATNYDGQSDTIEGAYEFVAGPTISSVSPDTAFRSGGDTVTVSGSDFNNVVTVRVGNQKVTPTVVSQSLLTFNLPAGTAGQSIDVTVEDELGQTDSLRNAITYTEFTPLIESVVPRYGPASGGQEVRLEGSALVAQSMAGVSAGDSHSLAIGNGGQKLYSWGVGEQGQLGNGSTDDQSTPVAVDTSGVLAGKTITAVAAGDTYSLALDSDGQVYAWGAGGSGRLGNGSTDDQSTPVAVDTSGVLAGKTITAIAAGGSHSLALDSDGQVYAWGAGGSGRLGNGSTASQTTPVAVDTSGVLTGKTITAIAAGENYSLVLDSDGRAYSWGAGTSGRLGSGSTSSESLPVAVDASGTLAGKTITAISAGNSHALALDSNGRVYSWGSSFQGRLGAGLSDSSSPIAVSTSGVLAGKVITNISAGGAHSLAVDNEGRAYAWGAGGYGRLASGGTHNQTTPVSVDTSGALGDKVVSSILAGGEHSLALDSEGQVYSWGRVTQLGRSASGGSGGTPVEIVTPQAALPTVTFGGIKANVISVNQDETVLIAATPAHEDGLVDVTITNYDGQTFILEDAYEFTSGPAISSVSPNTAPKSGGDTITVTGTGFSEGITLRLGNQEITPEIINGTTLTFVLPAGSAGQALDLTIEDEFNQTFTLEAAFTYTEPAPQINSVTPNRGPVSGGQEVTVEGQGLVAGPTRFTQVSAGAGHTLALNTEGQVYAWGVGASGRLGNGSSDRQLTPTPVDTTGALAGKTITAIAAGTSHSLVLDSEGQVYAWGAGANGQLGNGNATNQYVPVAVDTSGVLAGKTITAISVGYNHSLALDSDGQVYAWGLNNNGQLGNNTRDDQYVPVAVDTTGALAGKTITAISSSRDNSLALDSEGKVYAWGSGNVGLLGNGLSGGVQTTPIAVDTTGALAGKTITAIAAGTSHSLVLDSEGKVYAWGYNLYGQLGNNTTDYHPTPPVAVRASGVLSGKTVTSIAAGDHHSLALDSEGQVYAWGRDNYGQLGDNSSTADQTTPVAVDTTGALAGKTITAISAGGIHSLALDSDGQAYAWGQGNQGQLGNNTRDDQHTPVAASEIDIQPIITFGTTEALSLSADPNETSMLVETPSHAPGVVDVTITNYDGQSFTLENAYEFVEGPTISSVSPNTAPKAGGDTITVTGTGFGDGTILRLGEQEITPTILNEATLTFTLPPGTPGQALDITIEDEFNQTFTLDNAFTYTEPAPQIDSVTPNRGPVSGGQEVTIEGQGLVSGLTRFSNLSAGNSHTVAPSFNGQIYAWGGGTHSQLGIGDSTNQASPVPVVSSGVLSGKTITEVSGGLYHTLALDSDGKVYAWGGSLYGEIGDGTQYFSRSSPVAVDTSGALAGKTITAISAGSKHSLALDSNGQVYAWGTGSLGDGSGEVQTTPVTVDTSGVLNGKTITAISAGDGYSLALDSDGQVYAWGSGANGRLGNGSTTTQTTPVAVNTSGALAGKTITAIAAGSAHSLALDSDGQVYAWGSGANGRLGNNSTADRTTPIAVSTSGALAGKTITAIAAGSAHSLALDSDGQVYAWGYGANGRLGNGSTTTQTTPVAVNTSGALAGKTITAIAAGGSHSLALDSEGQIFAWGPDSNGRLGAGGVGDQTAPIATEDIYDTPPVVYFGTTPAYSLSADPSETSLAVQTPSREPGIVDVTVTNYDGQTFTLENAYEFVAGPSINSISPSFGSMSGGDEAVITGGNFGSDTKVKIGDQYIDSVTRVNDDTLIVTIPASLEAGLFDVVVEDEFGQTAVIEDGYTYRLPSPQISSVSPKLSQMRGGGTITISGSDFVDKSEGSWYQVIFGDVEATDVTYVDSTTLSATIPAGVPGIVDITVGGEFADGTILPDSFTYIADDYVFTNEPLSLAATQPGEVTIEARDSEGNPVTSTSDTEIMLSSDSSGGFFARDLEEDETTRWDYQSVILPAGESSVSFYYRDSNQGEPTITANVADIVSSTQDALIGSRYVFEVTGVSDPIQVGVPSSVTVRVTDWQGEPLTGYTGNISFSSSDQAAILPANYRMTLEDNGVKTFVNGVTMRTEGDFCVTATDTSNSTITGSQCGISVTPPNQGMITQLSIVTPEQSFPSNGYSSPITIQAQGSEDQPIPVDEDTPVYLFTDSETGQFSLDPTASWSGSQPFTATIPAGLTSVSVYYRDSGVRTSIISARDVETDTADHGGEGDFGWINDTQAITSGVGAPTKLGISGPSRLGIEERGSYVVELQDENGNPVTAENDIHIRIDGSTDTSRFYFLPGQEPRAGPTEFVIPGGSSRTTIEFSDSTPSELPNGYTELHLVDARPETESVRVEDATMNVTIGLNAPYQLIIQDLADTSVRKNTEVRIDTVDEFGNITYPEGEAIDLNLQTNRQGVFGEGSLAIPSGDSGVTTSYYGLDSGQHTLTATSDNLLGDQASLNLTPVAVSIIAPEEIIIQTDTELQVGFVDEQGNPITLDAPETMVELSLSHSSGQLKGSNVVTVQGGQAATAVTYRDTEVGERIVSGASSAEAVSGGEVQFEVVADEYDAELGGVAFISEPTVFTAGEASKVTIGFFDQYQAQTTLSSEAVVEVETTSSRGDFSMTAEPFEPVSEITVPAGTKDLELYYRDEQAGDVTFSVRDVALDPDEHQPSQQDNQVVAAAAAGYEFTTDQQLVVVDTPSSAIGVRLVDEFGNQAIAPEGGVNLNLTSDSSSGEFGRNTGSSEIPEISEWQSAASFEIATGASSASFYYRDGTAGSHSVTVSTEGLTEASQIIDVINGLAAQVVVEPSVDSVAAGSSAPVVISLQTEDGLPTVATEPTAIELESAGELSLLADPFTPITSLEFDRREGAKTVYFRSLEAGSKTITATSEDLSPGDGQIEVLAGDFARFVINPGTVSVPVSMASDPIAVSTTDFFGNVTVDEGETTVYMHASGPTTEFAVDPDGAWQDSVELTIPAGQTTALVHVRDDTFYEQPQTITASDQAQLDNPDTGILNGESTLSIVSQPVERLVMNTPERTVKAGHVSQAITVGLQKPDGTPAIQDGTSRLQLSVSEGRLAAVDSWLAVEIDEITIEQGESSATIYYTGLRVGEHTIVATLGDLSVTQRVIVEPDAPYKVDFTAGQQSVRAGEVSEPIRVIFRDQYDNPTELEEETIVELESSCDSGSFSEYASDWQPTNHLTLAAGSGDATIYYRDTVSGNCTLTVTATGLESGSALMRVDPGSPVRLSLVGGDTTRIKGEPHPVVVNLIDQFGNIATTSSRFTAEVSSSSATGQLGQTNLVFYTGQSTASTSYVDNYSGVSTISVADSRTSGALGGDQIELTYTEGEATAIGFDPKSVNMKAGASEEVTVSVVNEFGVPVAAEVDTEVTLSSSSQTGEFMNGTDSEASQLASVTIPAGETGVTVYYSQTDSGTATLEATTDLLDAGQANVTVLPEAIAGVRFAGPSYTESNPLQIGQNGQIRVELHDVYGNTTTTDTTLRLNIETDSETGQLASDYATIVAGGSSANLTYVEEVPGEYEVRIVDSELFDSTSQLIVVAYGAAYSFELSPSSTTLERGGVAEIDARVLNRYNRNVPAGEGGEVVNLRMNEGTGTFAAEPNGQYSSTLELQIPVGEKAQTFYYRNDDANIERRVCYTNVNGSRSCYVVQRYIHRILASATIDGSYRQSLARVNMQYGPATQLVFLTPERTQYARHTSDVLTIQRQNQYGKPVPVYTDTRVYLRSSAGSTGEFGTSPTNWGANYTTIQNNSSTTSFYYRDSQDGTPTITAADSLPLDPDVGMTNATQAITVERQIPDHLFVTNISTPQQAGTPSSAVVMARDSANHIVDWYDGTISFSSNDDGAMLPDSYKFNPQTDQGSHTFTNQVAFGTPGEKTVTATSDDGLTGSQENIIVTTGNNAPVAEVDISQPDSPARFVRGAASPPITLMLRDTDGAPTSAPTGGMQLRLTTNSQTGSFSAAPAGPWHDEELIVTVPEGYSFLNVYYRDNEMGRSTMTVSDWVDATDDQAITNDQLEVIISSVRLEGESEVYSQNVFGVYEPSLYMFANNAAGDIRARVNSSFAAYSLESGNQQRVDWRTQWRQGTRLIDSSQINNELTIEVNKDNVTTRAGQPDFYSIAEATDTSFARPDEVVSRQLTIPTSPWRVQVEAPEYALLGEDYEATARAYRSNSISSPAELQLVLLPAGASGLDQAIYTESIGGVGSYSFSLPADLPELASEDNLNRQYQIFAQLSDEDGNITAQSLSNPFTVVAQVPDPDPEDPEDPEDPGPGGPEQPGTPGQPDPDDPETPQPTTPETPGDQTIEPEPSVEGGESLEEDESEDTSEESETPVTAPVSGGRGEVSGAIDTDKHPLLQLPTAVSTTIVSAGTFLLIALVREAYKEVARVYHIRRLLSRQRQLASDKHTFLRLAGHYLRTPIAILEAALSTELAVNGSTEQVAQDSRAGMLASIQGSVARLRNRSEFLLEEDATKTLAPITDPNIKKATRSALKSPFFWLPLVLSVVLTIAVNWLLVATAAGEISSSGLVYASVIGIALILIVVFSLRTIHLNRERQRIAQALERYRQLLFAAKNNLIQQAEQALSSDVANLQSLSTHPQLITNDSLAGPVRDSLAKLTDLNTKLQLLTQINGVSLQADNVSAEELIDHAIYRHTGKAVGKQLKVDRKVNSKLKVRQDARLLRYVVSTVMDNAVKFSKVGGKVGVWAKRKGGDLVVQIKNDGGFGSEEAAKKVFEPFNHATNQDDLTAEGMGLSMYLNKLIIDQLGGEIKAINADGGKSAVVELRVPTKL